MDTSSKSAILKLILPHVPYLTRTAIWHTLYLSPTSTKWDLKTELTVKTIRAILASPSPHGALHRQQVSQKDSGIKGKMWISKVAISAPMSDDILPDFYRAIDDLKTSQAELYTRPTVILVEAEWTGYRPNVDAHRPRPDLSEAQHYDRLMSATTSPVTLLYFHGGAFVVMDPSSHRQPVSHLCKLTGGRALSVRYRLAPQSPFPAALLDAYIAYLSLLYPPPGSLHEPVEAKHVVFAGDSAGGNLCFSLIQLLLQLNQTARPGQTFRFHHHTIEFPIPLPAGCASHSPWLDISQAFPSKITNAKFDYLPTRWGPEALALLPEDDIWPANPPRGDLYCETGMLCHPLVSPAAARDWRGSPPMWFACGEEMLLDECKQVAQVAANQEVQVIWEEWEGMCHCFGMVLVGTPMSKRFFSDWAGFCKAVCGVRHDATSQDGEAQDAKGVQRTMSIETKGNLFEVKTGKEKAVDVRHLGVLNDDEALDRMHKAMAKRHDGPLRGDSSTSKL